MKINRLLAFVLCLSLAWASPLSAGNLTALAGSQWGGNAKQYIQFSAAGKVSGHGGCNRLFGTYSIKNNQLRFGPLASTKMACMGSIMQAEYRFHQDLKRVRRFDANHLVLRLLDDKGTLILKLKRRDWD